MNKFRGVDNYGQKHNDENIKTRFAFAEQNIKLIPKRYCTKPIDSNEKVRKNNKMKNPEIPIGVNYAENLRPGTFFIQITLGIEKNVMN
jgi:hypothetical protein